MESPNSLMEENHARVDKIFPLDNALRLKLVQDLNLDLKKNMSQRQATSKTIRVRQSI